MSVTLTPPLQEVRARLREKGIDTSVGELALAGAQGLLAEAEAREVEESRRQELRRRLVDRMRRGEAMDGEALGEIRRTGGTRT